MEQNAGSKITVEGIKRSNGTGSYEGIFNLSLTTHHGRSKVKNGSTEVHKNCSFIIIKNILRETDSLLPLLKIPLTVYIAFPPE